jgi:FkbM family methyltransferase
MAKAKTHSAKVQNFTANFLVSDEFHLLKREIFTHNNYYFATNNPEPVVVDAGAHIGLATMYFKHLYPNSKVIAIEPNPVIFKILTQNIFENQIENVQTINAALADHESSATPFFVDETKNQWFSTASLRKNAWTGDQKSKQILVPTILLSKVINQPIDFLKMDIEGAETMVCNAGRSVLPLIKQLAIEFHPFEGHNSDKIISLLEPHFFLEFFQDGKQHQSLKKVRGLFTIHGKKRR